MEHVTDFKNPEFAADPYTVYAKLREQSNVQWFPGLKAWIVLSYDLVSEGLSNPNLSSGSTRIDKGLTVLGNDAYERGREFIKDLATMIPFLDGKAHSEARGTVAGAFSRHCVEGLKPMVQGHIGDVMQSVPLGAPIEIVGCLAHAIPSRVICSILDISDALAPQMLAGIDRIADFFGNLPPSEMQFDNARIALHTMKCSFMAEFEKKPSKVIEKRGECDPRIAALTSVALLFAAVETTRSAIAASIYRLGIQPESMRRLRQDRNALPSFIEEVLRFDSPSQFMSRMAKSSIALGGQTVKTGEPIVFFIGAANRDPARFKNPNVFDMDREDNRHLAFGVGAHYCLGAHLARLEIRETLDAILSRCSAIEILEEPTWSQNKNFRGISSLRVRLVE